MGTGNRGAAVRNPTVIYDEDANAAYVRLSSDRVAKSEEVAPGVVLDDVEGRIVGMEIIDARGHLPPDLLVAAAA